MCQFNGMPATNVHATPLPIPIPEVLPRGIVKGWRQWTYKGRGLMYSPHFHKFWKPGEPMSGLPDPGEWGNKGVYAYSDERHYMEWQLWGQVALWGRVIKHTRLISHSLKSEGFRAEFAYPLTLFTNNKRTAEALVKTYGSTGVWINLKVPPGTPNRDAHGYAPYL